MFVSSVQRANIFATQFHPGKYIGSIGFTSPRFLATCTRTLPSSSSITYSSSPVPHGPQHLKLLTPSLLRFARSTTHTNTHSCVPPSEAIAKTVFSLYGDHLNTGSRQTPKVSSAIAKIYHCRILAEVQLAHDYLQIMVQAQGAGECSYEPMNVYMPTEGLYTLPHHMYHRRPTPHNSTQLLDSSHRDELQARPPTIERPFQIYLTHRTTRPRREGSNDIQVPLRTTENPPVFTK